MSGERHPEGNRDMSYHCIQFSLLFFFDFKQNLSVKNEFQDYIPFFLCELLVDLQSLNPCFAIGDSYMGPYSVTEGDLLIIIKAPFTRRNILKYSNTCSHFVMFLLVKSFD